MIEMTVNHYPFPFRFAVNGVVDGLHITQGHRVLVAFHPGRPEEGCHVFNAEPSNDRNREGWKFGELMLIAQMAADAPQFSFTEREKSLHRRKNASAAVSTEFRAIGGGAQPHKRSEARDGNGNRAETTNAPRLKPSPSGEGDAFIAGALAGRRSASPSAGRREISPIEEQAELEAIERMERALGFEPATGNYA